MAAKDFSNVYKILNKYGKEVISEMQTRLTSQNKIASGELYNSLRYDIQESLDDISLFFSMADHGVFVDKGVNGTEEKVGSPFSFSTKMPPPNKISDWMDQKGISPFAGQTKKQASFLIARSIYKFGIKPTQFFSISTTRRQAQLEKNIAKAMEDDLNNLLEE